jgi:transposase-like protein
MVTEKVDGLAWLRKQVEAADKDLLREMVQRMAEMLMGAETDGICGAPHRQPSTDWVNRRNGYRERRWDTREGLGVRPSFLAFLVFVRPL